MAWSKNPRTVTKEQFSTGTTIDGNRIDNALDDVVDRVNEVPYGDLRKRWVPITYVAGWTPQSPKTLEMDSGDPDESDDGKIAATHHWPWLRVKNYDDEVVDGTLGAASDDDLRFTNPFRLKGVQVPGIHPYGRAQATGTTYTGAQAPIGAQYAWTRSWFIERPSILSAIDLVLELDHGDVATADQVYRNTFLYGDGSPALPPDGLLGSSNDMGLVITAAVDNEFAKEDRNMVDVEVLRRGFQINNDKISTLALSKASGVSPTYNDFVPKPGTTECGASTIQGVHISLGRQEPGAVGLNIPIHQRARLRVSVVIPSYPASAPVMRPNGWNPVALRDYPWLQQKIHMTVTMLEEVTSG